MNKVDQWIEGVGGKLSQGCVDGESNTVLLFLFQFRFDVSSSVVIGTNTPKLYVTVQNVLPQIRRVTADVNICG